MDHIQRMMQIDYVAFFVTLFAILFGIKEIIELLSYFVKKFGVKFKKDTEKECMEDKVATLEKHDNWQYKEILKISKGIDDIKKQLELTKKETNQRIVVQYGAELYNLHSKFMAQGYVTRAGLETFQLLADTYISCGGNHSIKGKIIPEVMALNIKDE